MADRRPPDLTTEQMASQMWLSVMGDNAGEEGVQAASPAACASFAREERLQFQFMVFYQALVALLSLLALLLLVLAGYLLLKDEPKRFEGVLSGVATLVASGGALFLTRQRKDARKMFTAAQENLSNGNCA